MALYILRLCLFAPKFMYLLRCSPFWKYPLISVLDVSLEDIHHHPDIQSISSIALPAFLSSASGSITLISQILNLTSPTDVVVESLAEAKSAWSASCPGKDYPIAVECQGLWDKPRVILTHADLQVAQCTSATDKARILAVSEKESGHWLHALPSHSLGAILDQTALRVAVCLGLGIKRVLLATLWWRALPAAALMLLSDAVRAPRRAALHDAPSLAELLLRAALCRLPPDDDGSAPQWELGAPKLEDLERVLAVWERQQRFAPAQDAERVMLFGRVLAVAPPALRPPLLRRLGAARPALLDDKLAVARADRKVGVCKLQILFGAEEKANMHKAKTPVKDKGKRR
ncbi:uncharacterized protein [Maniola hyperantus]|uniref:uncharacterized protein isoform X2 n=1 Tax=Aphantopus hyperantus TaxID=2795564 RepID=UPI003748F60B